MVLANQALFHHTQFSVGIIVWNVIKAVYRCSTLCFVYLFGVCFPPLNWYDIRNKTEQNRRVAKLPAERGGHLKV